MITCSDRLEALAVPGLPLVGRGDDVPALVWRALLGARGSRSPTATSSS